MSGSDDSARGGLESRLDRLYDVRFPHGERAEKAALWRTLCDAFFARYSTTEATVVDLGAGFCDFINAIPGKRKIALDLNPQTASHAAPGVEVHGVPLVDLGTVVADGLADLAFASNVFEHLRSPDELLAVLAAVKRCLKPSGRLVVMQPNVRMLGGRFWDFFDHTLPLTEKGMAEALAVAGFEIEELRARFLPYTTRSVLPQWSVLVRAYLAFPPAQWLLGKQMLVVARKPAR